MPACLESSVCNISKQPLSAAKNLLSRGTFWRCMLRCHKLRPLARHTNRVSLTGSP